MNINKIKDLKAERGFTIVELLIVIVVIGILAAITMVAYGSIQNRAKAAQYQSDASNLAKVAETINAGENSPGYPTTAALFTGSADAKLPTNVTVGTPVGSAPAASAAGPTVNSSTGLKTYVWRSCGASTGVVIYYQHPVDSTLKSVSAGAGC